MTTPAKKEPKPTFESALARVEQIAAQMETGDLPLEELVTAYEEGLRLLRFCSERLEVAEKRLETITRDAAGRPQGLATVSTTEEIPSSTTPDSSGTGEDSSGPKNPSEPVRLF